MDGWIDRAYLQAIRSELGMVCLLVLLLLLRPGEADLSVDVDFDAVRRAALSQAAGLRVSPLLDQRDFLAAMGLEPR